MVGRGDAILINDETEQHYKRLLNEACREIARYKIEAEALKIENEKLKEKLQQLSKIVLKLPVGVVK